MGFRGGASGAGTSVQFAPPSESIEIGDPVVAGISPRLPRADHGHPFPAPPAGVVTDLTAAKDDGALNAPARANHRHGHTAAMHIAGGHADLSAQFSATAYRVSTGAVAAAGTADVVVALNPVMPDLNYTVDVAVEEASAGDTLRIRKIVSRALDQVVVRVANQDALLARTGTLHVLIRHDSQNPAINAFVPLWKPLTAYTAGQAVINPSNRIVTAIAAHTSGAAYIDASWTAPRLQVGSRVINVDARVKAQLFDDSSSGMVIELFKVGGDGLDLNVDGAVMVKHGKDYVGSGGGYADTVQCYSLAGSQGTIIGNNNYVGDKTLPYNPPTADAATQPNGYIRFELGPVWPLSEKMRLNNRGELILGWTEVRQVTASQTGTTVTITAGNNFVASDVGKFIMWRGKNSVADRITAWISATQVTVETSREIASVAQVMVLKPGTVIDQAGVVQTSLGHKIKLMAGQTTDLQQWLTDVGGVMGGWKSWGGLFVGADSLGSFFSVVPTNDSVAVSARGFAGGAADMLQLIGQGGTPVVKASSTGVWSAFFTDIGAIRALEVGGLDSGGAGYRFVKVAN